MFIILCYRLDWTEPLTELFKMKLGLGLVQVSLLSSVGVPGEVYNATSLYLIIKV